MNDREDPNQALHLSTLDGYEKWAEFYDEDDIPLAILEEPVVDAELGNLHGLEVLDLGCGTGRQSVRLAQKGARVIGLDGSPAMLEKAREKTHPNLELISHNLTQPLPFENERFARVVSFLVLDHIENLEFFFQEAKRVCARDGILFFSVMHPALMLKGARARFTDKTTGKKVYPKSQSHQIYHYVNALLKAKLNLQKMGEFALSESHSHATKKVDRYLGWPMLLTFTCRRD